jgi:hypothetical protein
MLCMQVSLSVRSDTSKRYTSMSTRGELLVEATLLLLTCTNICVTDRTRTGTFG